MYDVETQKLIKKSTVFLLSFLNMGCSLAVITYVYSGLIIEVIRAELSFV